MEKVSKNIYSVILLGISGVGKSTIVFYLENGYPPPRSIKPTIAFGISHIAFGNVVLGLIDVGGQRQFLNMGFHKRFVRSADGLVFVLDSSKNDFRYDEQWLSDALTFLTREIPILVIANKQDLPNALPPDFFKKNFLNKYLSEHSYSIFGTVAADPGGIRSGENIRLAFNHLILQMTKNQKISIKQQQIH